MRKPVLLATMVVMLAALAAVTSDSARAEKPVGHVSGSFTAEYMGRQSVGGPIVRLGAVRITVNAHDRDPATDFACPSCPGLDSGAIAAETTIDAPGELDVQGQPLQNDFTESFGPISLDTALTNSVNTWFAQLGEQLGADTLFEYMDAFGFNSRPAIDLPADQVYESGVYGEGELLGRGDPVDVARIAIGQERLAVTPLQMAEVAAAVANGGRLMRPQIWSRVVDPDGRVSKRLDPSEYSRPIDEQTAAELTTAMEGVVSEGTGTNAAIPGVPVAGKTGTAETPGNKACGGGENENQAWFIGFAPSDDPEIAIAATVECTEQFGNDVAAPIFREVAETILNQG